ncbi:MAG: CCA tRNA nucleotidyltransferase, partial [Ruminiclostridium sp.]
MNYIDKIVFPKNVGYIIEKLNLCGFEAFIVGGCVRDSILGRIPDDWDITTNALPMDIKRIFKKT